MGLSPQELYDKVVRADERVAALIAGGTCQSEVLTTKDWSFVASRAYGENWFLVGESVGFADPILSAGLTLTHTGARELAYTIAALERGEHDAEWLKAHYESNQQSRIRQHIRFADFWYASNGQFTDLQENCRKIAADAGLELTSRNAWRWLAQGGFTNDTAGQAGIGGYDLSGMKSVTQRFTRTPAKWTVGDYNVFKLDLLGAKEETLPVYEDGRIHAVKCFVRGSKRLALTGVFDTLYQLLRKTSDVGTIYNSIQSAALARLGPAHAQVMVMHCVQGLEVLANDRWVACKFDPRKPKLTITTPDEGRVIHANRDELPGGGGKN